MQHADARVGHVDNVDNQFQVAQSRSPKPCALPGVDNVDNCFLLVHMIHKAFFFAPVRIEAWTFVDKVDNVDARFKLVADEVSCLRYTPSYKYLYFNLLSFFYYPHCPHHL